MQQQRQIVTCKGSAMEQSSTLYTNPLNSETHDSPAHFKQLPVPYDNSALAILQICITTTTTTTGLQAYDDHHFSLNDVTAPQAFSATTATMTAMMTQVPTTTTAITKEALLKLDKCFLHSAKTTAKNSTIKSESLLLHDRFGSAILTARFFCAKSLAAYCPR
jgi:hypothetical protein